MESYISPAMLKQCREAEYNHYSVGLAPVLEVYEALYEFS